jgi:hypothetical protein
VRASHGLYYAVSRTSGARSAQVFEFSRRAIKLVVMASRILKNGLRFPCPVAPWFSDPQPAFGRRGRGSAEFALFKVADVPYP